MKYRTGEKVQVGDVVRLSKKVLQENNVQDESVGTVVAVNVLDGLNNAEVETISCRWDLSSRMMTLISRKNPS